MDKRQVIREWREVTEDATVALRDWLDSLREWERNDGELAPGDFDAAFNRLYREGLGEWADANPAGDGLDTLAAAVRGEELPDKEPSDEASILAAVFGEV